MVFPWADAGEGFGICIGIEVGTEYNVIGAVGAAEEPADDNEEAEGLRSAVGTCSAESNDTVGMIS